MRMQPGLSVAQIVRPAQGGIRRHVSLLVEGLARTEFSCELYAPRDFSLEESAPDTVAHEVDIGARTNLARDLRAIRALTTLLHGEAAIVHSHGLRAALVGTLAANRANVPAVVTVHNLIPSMNSLQGLVLKRVLKGSRCIIAVSSAISNSLLSLGVPQSKLRVIPNGVNIETYLRAPLFDRAEFGLPTSAQIVTYVGRLSPEKGVPTLIEAVQKLRPGPDKLAVLIVGDGPDSDLLRHMSEGTPEIRFLGHRSDIPTIMSGSDIIVAPSNSEGQGIVAIEAMACGAPVIASDVGGLPETVVDGVTGMLCPARDSRRFADCIQLLLGDPTARRSMGIAGRERARSVYSIEQMINSTVQVYRDILDLNT